MTITPEDVARLREKATPGPWLRDCWDILGKGTRHGGGTGHVCEVSCPNGTDDYYWNEGEADANAAFIAAAHDMADLVAEQARVIAELRAQQEAADALAKAVSKWGESYYADEEDAAIEVVKATLAAYRAARGQK